MTHLLFVLAHLVLANASNSTGCSCPQPVGGATTRSVWSILGSCALTLLICIWHAIHFDISYSKDEWYEGPVGLVLWSIFAPEVVIMAAIRQWWEARRKVITFREKGYEWSMTHSFFAEMGGFVYCDDKGKSRTINSLEFLELCEANKIANPRITVKQIKALSKSDALGKAIFVIQLLWFALQVIVRGSHGLAITLVEIDTVSVAALTLIVLWFWWEKPHHPQCPHIFYYLAPEVEPHPQTDSVLKTVWKAEPSRLYTLVVGFFCLRKTRTISGEEEIALVGTNDKPVHSTSRDLVAKIDADGAVYLSFFSSWTVLGVFHLIAWNFDFPTEAEEILWRVASLVLAAGSLVTLFFGIFICICLICLGMNDDKAQNVAAGLGTFAFLLGIVARLLLLGLILSSLRALPPSAYQTVSWTAYIPHL